MASVMWVLETDVITLSATTVVTNKNPITHATWNAGRFTSAVTLLAAPGVDGDLGDFRGDFAIFNTSSSHQSIRVSNLGSVQLAL
eukprot:CAMPEP_0185850506 /NCGR_PEP_ID=MMETSP1354-20130828/4619_1 /TAXON_ID=708628 /ORGANISM="Erythrolobus madagascarensis, Strain CCMP3276" /LENGTH=84 /DNA_ID=CAMNT_0028551193 /DNA_START=293 /DNA_END=547 /DNA_ORIENTATION=-